VFYLL
jgi:hypothetical protein